MVDNLVLGESLDVLIDHRGKTPKKLGSDFVESGVPVASAIMVKDGRLDLAEARYVDDETFRRWMPVQVRSGDVLLTSEAPLGRLARVRESGPLVLGQRLFGLRGRPGILDSGYLYYALQTERVQADLVGRSTGTTVTGIRQSALRSVVIPAPSFVEQQAVAEVLGALDDKITASEQIVRRAEELAISLAELSDSEARVHDLARAFSRGSSPSSFSPVVALFSLPAFDESAEPDVVGRDDIMSNKVVLNVPAVLVSKLNPRIPRIWNVNRIPDLMAVASMEFVVLTPVGVSASVLWAVMREPSVSVKLAGKVAGTSGSHQRVKPTDVLELSVLDPRALSERVRAQIDVLGDVAHAHKAERKRLVNTRGELLPLLMSGRVRVKDAEKVVEEVL